MFTLLVSSVGPDNIGQSLVCDFFRSASAADKARKLADSRKSENDLNRTTFFVLPGRIETTRSSI